jgi:hypothetical protein
MNRAQPKAGQQIEDAFAHSRASESGWEDLLLFGTELRGSSPVKAYGDLKLLAWKSAPAHGR